MANFGIGAVGFGRQDYGITAGKGTRTSKNRSLEMIIGAQAPSLINLKALEAQGKNAADLLQVEKDKLGATIAQTEKEILALNARSKAEIASNEELSAKKLDFEKQLSDEEIKEAKEGRKASSLIGAAQLGTSAISGYYTLKNAGVLKDVFGGGKSVLPNTTVAEGAETVGVGATGMGTGAAMGTEAYGMGAGGAMGLGEAGGGAAAGEAAGIGAGLASYAGPAAIIAIAAKLGSMGYSDYKKDKAYDEWLASPEGQTYVKAIGEQEQTEGKQLTSLSPLEQVKAITEWTKYLGTADIENRIDAAIREGANIDKPTIMGGVYREIYGTAGEEKWGSGQGYGEGAQYWNKAQNKISEMIA